MIRFSQLAIFSALSLVWVSVVLGAAIFPALPKPKEDPVPALFHADPEHLWNRVHAAFFLRIGPDGRSYGKDRLEPLLWHHSKFLLEGKPAERAQAVLEEFLREHGKSLIEDPVKRAILQRDLWLVSNWLAEKRDDDTRQRISPLLAKVIRQLSLTSEQVAKLPDNYEATVAAKKHATRFNAENPQGSYLPDDLFKTEGPWVSIGRTDGPTAPFHVREVTNSVFLIFLKLPGGRDKTLAFLRALAAFDQPLFLPNDDEKTQRSFTHLPNPALPKWPEGTEVALVRRALLIDSSHRVVASPLTESVQLRTMIAEAPTLTREVLNKISARAGTSGQVFGEFQLRRAELVEGKAGGLRDVSEERDFKTGFNSHGFDEFDQPQSNERPFPQRAYFFTSNRMSCVACHSAPGVYGFNSIPAFAFGLRSTPTNDEGGEFKPPPLAAMQPDEVAKTVVKWKERQPSWIALRKLLVD